MTPFETINAAYAAFGRNDPSVLFAAMDPAIAWNEAEGNPLADRNPYVGPQAIQSLRDLLVGRMPLRQQVENRRAAHAERAQ